MDDEKDWGFATKALHTKLSRQEWDCSSGLMSAITPAATYLMSSTGEIQGEPIYGRYGNPSRNSVEAILARLEGAEHAMCFSSGMAAVNVVMETLQSGDHVVASNQLYGGVYNLIQNGLPKIGIEVTMVDIFDLEKLRLSLKSNTRLVWFEACSNPLNMVVDLKATLAAVKEFNGEIIVAIDNTFLSPWIVRPLEFGADLVMHSASKYLGGHADLIMGVLATSQPKLFKELKTLQRNRGATPSPFDCYLLERSLQTLEVRMERHNLSSLQVAKFLSAHPKVIKVNHPLLESSPHRPLALDQHKGRHSGMMAFYLQGEKEKAVKFLDEIRIVNRAASLGGTHSLACHPCSITHVQLTQQEKEITGITDNVIRLSIGLENAEDIIADLDQALSKI